MKINSLFFGKSMGWISLALVWSGSAFCMESADATLRTIWAIYGQYPRMHLFLDLHPKDDGSLLQLAGKPVSLKGDPVEYVRYDQQYQGQEKEIKFTLGYDSLPENECLPLRMEIPLMRVKPGKVFAPIELPASGKGEWVLGGVRFCYSTVEKEDCCLGEANIRIMCNVEYPSSASLAAVTFRGGNADENEWMIQEGTSERTYASYLATHPRGQKLAVVVTPAETRIPCRLALSKDLSLGGFDQPHSEPHARVSEVIRMSGNSYVEELQLQELLIHYAGVRRMLLCFRVKQKEGVLLTGNDSATSLRGKDALGNDLKGQVITFCKNENQETEVLGFITSDGPLPQGDWAEYEGEIGFRKARGLRDLGSQTVTLGQAGSFEAGGIRFTYGEGEKQQTARRRDSPQELAISYSEGTPVAWIRFCDDQGEIVPKSIRRGNTRTFQFPSPAPERVHVSVGVWEGFEPVVLPVKFRLGLNGILEGDGTPSESDPSGEKIGK